MPNKGDGIGNDYRKNNIKKRGSNWEHNNIGAYKKEEMY